MIRRTLMNIRTIVTLGSLSLLAGGVVVACSEDDKKTSPAEDGGNTDHDAGGGSDGATASDSSSSTDSPFVQDTGPVDAGQCTASDPMFASGFQASCSTCLATQCCSQVKACEAVADCKAFAQCYASCVGDGGNQGTCTGPCIAGKDGGGIQSVYNQFVLCGGNACNNDGGASAPKCPF